ncbi:hypothetical protein Cgig2_020304 [Carnegiea gigantea]|uniref:DUF7054 domain-containing protein n=1 Tax=Carnegiea gigantea TaxID=171969 RepID=A0A9Q1QEF8_9CARY|nr:hypothetical protein Cgig2_020304 [Carnegiea gigantea]
MPSPRAHTRNANVGRVSDKSVSFYGRGGGSLPAPEKIRRPRTLPDLMVRDRNVASLVASPTAAASPKPKLTKVLLNVTVQGSVGAVQVLISPESRVRDLIFVTLKQYLKEGRRPVISGLSVDDFDLHYSQFSLESLDREEKLETLGSRNFFLCKRKAVVDGGANGGVPVTSCSTQAEKVAKLNPNPCPWLKFISYLF